MIKICFRMITAALIGAGVVSFAPHSVFAGEGTLVNIKLTDSDAGMEVRTDRNRAVAGPVSFAATNISPSGLEHEMLVLKVDSDAPKLPYDKTTGRVPEDKINALGEVPEVGTGQGGALTLNLTPGTYLLFCNKPGHFKAGMKQLFYVQ